MLLVFLELCVNILIFGFMLSQVIIPIWKGTKLFPAFRKATIEAEQGRANAKDELVNANINCETTEIEEVIEEVKRRRKKKKEDKDGV
jgi:hypothetical protein